MIILVELYRNLKLQANIPKVVGSKAKMSLEHIVKKRSEGLLD